MRRILIPLNITEISPTILPVVRHLFPPAEVELILLGVTQRPDSPILLAGYVGDIPHTTYLTPCSDEEWERHQQHFAVELKQLAATLRDRGYSVETIVRVGEPVAQILTTVASGTYDLIAMATREHTGLARFLLGSVAESVLRQAPIPMLLMQTARAVKESPTAAQAKPESLIYEPALAHAL
jgi:nucleotide-binding universal stress UspA family protein